MPTARPLERRKAIRRHPQAGIVFRTSDDNLWLTSNISTDGICLTLATPASTGALIRGELLSPTFRTAIAVAVRVVHSCRVGEGFFVGGYFETPLAEEQVRKLVSIRAA